MILLDTDHLSVLTDRRAARNPALVRRPGRAEAPPPLPTAVVEEQGKGWLAKIKRSREIHAQINPYERLAELFDFLAEWDIVSLNKAAADQFAQLRRQKIRIGAQDLKIAALALTRNALLLSAN